MARRISTTAFVLVALVFLLMLNEGIASADGLVTIDCTQGDTACPRCPVIGPETFRRPDCAAYLRVKNHNVTVTINNQLAQTHVDETFVNDSDTELEGTYMFPLPDDAAISDFAMYVDGVRLDGQVLDRDQARQIYEDIVRRQRDPALLEYLGRSLFKARIFPIAPHAEKRVEISYAQVLKNENGLVRYVYPLSTEKFSTAPLGSVSINVALTSNQELKAIYSPSHKISVARTNDFSAKIGYEDSNVKPNRDFALYYSVSSSEVGATLLSYKPDNSTDGFFLLLVAPKVNVEEKSVIAKDVIMVLDTSGSMQGEKIVQAKSALKYVLGELNPIDRFNIVSFSTGIVPFANSMQPASVRGDAENFVERLDAGGSTDINRALLTALDDVDSERPTIVIFITDGLPTVGETDIQRILSNVDRAAPSNVRLFSFGVGDDVNTVLLDSLGEKHRGTSAYVRPGEAIDETVTDFYQKVATPVLSDMTLDWGGMQIRDSYPYPLPDLFAGSQLVLAGRYKQGGPASLTLKGNINGDQKSYTFQDLTFASEGGDDFIAPLWATRKIGYLMSQIRLNGENREAVDEIVELAIRYGIVTPYTSFLIQEDRDVLSPAGRSNVVQDAQAQFAPAAAPTSGAKAVTLSQANRVLKEAESVAVEASTQLKTVGDKTFLMQNGVWTDTSYNRDTTQTTKVSFGSEAYFQLSTLHPEWGKFLAVGEKVLFVVGDTAYEVTGGD